MDGSYKMPMTYHILMRNNDGVQSMESSIRAVQQLNTK